MDMIFLKKSISSAGAETATRAATAVIILFISRLW
jgi:hypothetical protein